MTPGALVGRKRSARHRIEIYRSMTCGRVAAATTAPVDTTLSAQGGGYDAAACSHPQRRRVARPHRTTTLPVGAVYEWVGAARLRGGGAVLGHGPRPRRRSCRRPAPRVRGLRRRRRPGDLPRSPPRRGVAGRRSGGSRCCIASVSLEVGESAVVAAVSAPHRPEAFEAARFAIDALKASVPIWKHETWSDGADWGTGAHTDRPTSDRIARRDLDRHRASSSSPRRSSSCCRRAASTSRPTASTRSSARSTRCRREAATHGRRAGAASRGRTSAKRPTTAGTTGRRRRRWHVTSPSTSEPPTPSST